MRRLLDDTLRQYGLALGSLAKIATADLKADEEGIIALAQSLGVPLAVYPAAQLDVAGRAGTDAGVTPSAARELLGVFGVAEPAALLASGGRRLLIPRTRSDRATVAVARIPADAADTSAAHHYRQCHYPRHNSRGNS